MLVTFFYFYLFFYFIFTSFKVDKHTFDVPTLGPCILSPSPYRVIKQGHTHATPDLQRQSVVDLPIISRRGTSQSPHLRQNLCQPFWEVVAGHGHATDGPDSSVEEVPGVIHIDVSGKEALSQLLQRASSCHHHLVDIVRCVR